MSKIKGVRQTLARFSQVIGGRGLRWLAVCFLSSLLLAVVEYALVGFLQLFLMNLGYFDRAQIPSVLLPLAALGTVGLCALLVLIGASRAFALFMSAYSNDVTQEIVSYRFKQVTIFEMLMRKGRRFLPASEVHFRVAEVYPRSLNFVFNANSMIISGTMVTALIGGMFYLAWRETLIGLAGLFLSGLMVIVSNRKLGKMPVWSCLFKSNSPRELSAFPETGSLSASAEPRSRNTSG